MSKESPEKGKDFSSRNEGFFAYTMEQVFEGAFEFITFPEQIVEDLEAVLGL